MKIGITRVSLASMLSILLVTIVTAGGTPQEEAPGPVAFLRTINTAEITYSRTYNKGFSGALKNLGAPPAGLKPSATTAYLVDEDLAAGKKKNYVFTYKPSAPDKDGKINAYTVTARPLKWEKGLKELLHGSVRGNSVDGREPHAQGKRPGDLIAPAWLETAEGFCAAGGPRRTRLGASCGGD